MHTPTNTAPSVRDGDLAKALRDAYGRGHATGISGWAQTHAEYCEKRDAWIRQYMARMPVALSVRDGLTVYSTATDRARLSNFVRSDVDGERLARVITDASQWAEHVAAAPVSSSGDGDGGELERLRADFPGDRFEGELTLREAALEVVNWFDKDGSVGTLPDYIMDLRSAIKSDEVHRSGKLVLASGSGKEKGADLVAYLHRQWAWSKETFGPALRTKGIVQHITKELREIEAEPHDLAEWVDVIILAMDGFWRHGGKPEDLLPAMQAKQDRNFARTWPDWRTMGEDQAIEHDRTGEARTPEPSPQSSPTLKTGSMAVEEAKEVLREVPRPMTPEGLVMWLRGTADHVHNTARKAGMRDRADAIETALRTLQGEAEE
jgi:hypothetical protein